ncbi:Heterokaryon incompatibility protein 6, OR allele [Colletotrichum fructicola]|nr:Heterokaryon incompatibility protein 6, OR allele [Colletotrichum fructicola]
MAFTLMISYAYKPLRDRGVFGDIGDSTVFRVIPPKLVEPPDGADETIYRPTTQEKEIRLLVLEPGAPGDELKCRLIHAQLSWRTRYEALSYVWGDGTVTRPLSCSGRTEVVHINLHDALSDLRLPDRERILWTDRLCINQSDDEEKTAQIKLMGEIYSQASQVLIYLGKMDPSVEGAMEAMRRVESELGTFHSGSYLGVFNMMRYLFKKDEINWDPIINLLRRPWFQRTWIFQEVVLAKRGQVICGQQSIPWAVFEKAVQSMAFHKSYFKNIPAYQSMDGIVSGMSLMTSARSIRHRDGLSFLPRLVLWLIFGSWPDGKDRLKLLDLILESRSLSCTHSEDKIFGMLGVTSQDTGSAYLAKDSSLSPGDVFRNFVLWDIFNNNSLRALGSSSDKAGSQYSSPSWVPDFERLDPQSSLTGTKNHVRFDASAGLPKQVWTSNEETVLHVKGRIVDTLHTVGKASPSTPDTFAGENAHVRHFESLDHLLINKCMIEEAKDIWLSSVKRLDHCSEPVIKARVDYGSLAATRADGKMTWAPFLRTLICDRTKEGQEPPTDFIIGEVASFVRQTLEVDVVPEYLLQLQGNRSKGISGLEAFLALTESRRFAATDIGLIGYVPMRAKKGDLVCILHGSEVPFVIRKETGGKYSVVGECFMHGIMEGQALQMESIKDEVFSFI